MTDDWNLAELRLMRTKFFLGLLGRVTPLTIAFVIAIVSPDNFKKGCWYVAAIAILVVSEYVGIYRPLANRDELRKKQTDCYLKSFVSTASISGKKVTIRVNVMLIRRFWLRRHFFQFYQLGMAGYPDANLHFSIHKGLCGRVLNEQMQRVTFMDFRTTPWNDGWSEKEVRLVRHITAVATIPLLRETKTLRGHPTTEYFGCLNVDSVDDLGADFLAVQNAQEQIRALAEIVQVTFA